MTIGILADKQNRDGGWPYVRGSSWTEPTVYAVLASLAAGETEPAQRGLRWIRATGRPDGGWPPKPGVEQSTWVTALVALLPPEQLGARAHARAIAWLLETAKAVPPETNNPKNIQRYTFLKKFLVSCCTCEAVISMLFCYF